MTETPFWEKPLAERLADHSLTPARASWPTKQTAQLVLDVLKEQGYRIFHDGPVDPQSCYECGEHVLPNQGERHGRAGWVHNKCLSPDPWTNQTVTIGPDSRGSHIS